MTAEGRFIGAHGAARDVSERDRLERDLRRQAGELAAGEERAHLARELHDSVTQALFSMTLVSRSVEMLLDRDPAPATSPARRSCATSSARRSRRCVRSSSSCGRATSSRTACRARCGPTRPRSRAGSGCRSWSRARSRSACRCPIEEVLYRIAQEALHNVVKHADARQVRVEVGRIASGVRLRIQRRRQGLRPGARAGRPPRAGRDARPRRQDRRPLHVPQRAGRGDHDRGRRPGRRDRRRPVPGPVAGRGLRRSATDDVGAVRRSAEADRRQRSVPHRPATPPATIDAMHDPDPGPPQPLRVVVVDADDRVRESLTGLLCIGDRLEVVGSAGETDAALDARPARRSPDVVVVDPRLPEMDGGLAFIGRLRADRARASASSSWPDPIRLELADARDGRRRLRPQDIPRQRPARGDPRGGPARPALMSAGGRSLC